MTSCNTVRNIRHLTGSAVICVFLLLSGPVQATYVLGDTVDDFTLDDLAGIPTSLSEYAGDIIVLNFFATWCPGCNVEAAILENNIHQAYQEHGVTVIAVDMQEQVTVVQNWAAGQGVTYQILMSPTWDLFALFPQAGGLPYNAIIDSEMKLIYAKILFDEEAITTTLDNLLGFTPVAERARSFGQVKVLFR